MAIFKGKQLPFIMKVAKLQQKTATANGNVTADSGYDGLSQVTVNVSAPTPALEIKSVAPQTTPLVVTPDAGYDGLSEVDVAAIQTEQKTANENGIVIPTNGHYLSKVTVNVPTTQTQTKTVALSIGSGNQTVNADTGKAMTSVTVLKPTTAIPENIKRGIDIGGVVGILDCASDYTVAVGDTVEISYSGSSPEVTITPAGALSYYDDGGAIMLTGEIAGSATVTLTVVTPDGDVDTDYNVLVVEDSGKPKEINTASEMTAVLTAENVGKAYKYTGTTDSTYTNGDIYIVEVG